MIKYNLKCEKNHEFESWFADSNEFEKLRTKCLLDCIYCNSKKIEKSIMAPMVKGPKEFEFNLIDDKQNFNSEKSQLLKIRKYIEKNFEFVGENFSDKVREIYYDKNSQKTIYGTANRKEREELSEEGIDLITIPWIEKDN